MGVRSSNPPALAQCPEHFLAREGNSLAEGDRRDSAAAMCWATALPVTRCRRRVRPTRSPTSNWVERQVSDELPVIQMDLFLDAATAADGRTATFFCGCFAPARSCPVYAMQVMTNGLPSPDIHDLA